MRIARLLTAAGLGWALAVSLSITPQAQGQMTEADFATMMKAVGAANGGIRTAMQGQDMAALATNAKKMADLMKQNQTFWTEQKNQEAADWAKGALDHATQLAAAAEAKDANGTAEHAKALGGTCAQCHTKYREKAADGSYMIKKG